MTSKPIIERFITKFEVDPASGCWVWTAATNGDGYPVIGTEPPERSHRSAHRFAYEYWHGRKPRFTIDHLCRNRRCVNPDHLEDVPLAVNIMRSPIAIATVNAAKTHCVNAHPFDEVNTYTDKLGYRHCRPCDNERHREYARR